MKQKIEDPVRTSNGRDETTETHPAYAQIAASRVAGHAILYGSGFSHQHYMTIRIAGSSMRRSLSNDWPFAESMPYIEVAMSEAQWAHFVSSPNSGSGSCCTLEYLKGAGDIPGLPDPESVRAKFALESDDRIKDAMRALADLTDAVAASGLSAKKQHELLWQVSTAQAQIGRSQKFVADQFSEHMETVTEQAKSEIDGYLMATLQSAGLKAISDMRETVGMIGKDDASR